jgi:hypothetical protein
VRYTSSLVPSYLAAHFPENTSLTRLWSGWKSSEIFLLCFSSSRSLSTCIHLLACTTLSFPLSSRSLGRWLSFWSHWISVSSLSEFWSPHLTSIRCCHDRYDGHNFFAWSAQDGKIEFHLNCILNGLKCVPLIRSTFSCIRWVCAHS